MLPTFEQETAPLSPQEWSEARTVRAILLETFAQDNSITNARISEQVVARLGGKPRHPARIRKMIHHLHTGGELPNLIATGKGYAQATGMADLEQYEESLAGRVSAIKHRLAAVRKDKRRLLQKNQR